jgi:hypothetical protein
MGKWSMVFLAIILSSACQAQNVGTDEPDGFALDVEHTENEHQKTILVLDSFLDVEREIVSEFEVKIRMDEDHGDFETVVRLQNGVLVDPRRGYGDDGDIFVVLLDLNYDYGDPKVKNYNFYGCNAEIIINQENGLPLKLIIIPYFEDGEIKGSQLEFDWKEFSEISTFFRYETAIP